ncbi:hypothetical protein AB6A40_010487 [Gnathostoma spinigerum]|uniref:histone acetyltransferase n=1 Tax=Gnathostoma spinigerum TaxID=75299 RepID=A0ABD6EVE8_9BILA
MDFGDKWPVESLVDGARLKVKMTGTGNYREAEILSIKPTADGKYRFYVHYIDCNRRLDEWVDEASLDLSNVRFPQKGGKIHKNQIETASSSRASSAEREMPSKKGGSRKRKQPTDAMEYVKVEEPTTQPPSPFSMQVDQKGISA